MPAKGDMGTLSAKMELDAKKFNADLAKAERNTKSFAFKSNKAIGKLEKSFNKTAKEASEMTDKLSKMAVGAAALAGVAALGAIAKGTISTGVAFQRFGVQLETIEGSSEKARKAMEWISEFAATTPYELADVTDAFTKMRAYGLDAIKYLPVLGDTASAMGKDLNAAVEAMADAVTGEFERLKEFGVKTSQQGDKVAFKWSENGQDMQVTANKTASGISEALVGIFDRFEGGMEKQSKTLAGTWSNLMDTIAAVENKIFTSGVGDELTKTIKGASDALKKWVDENDEFIARQIPVYIAEIKANITALAHVTGDAITGFRMMGEAWDKFWSGPSTEEIRRENVAKYSETIARLESRLAGVADKESARARNLQGQIAKQRALMNVTKERIKMDRLLDVPDVTKPNVEIKQIAKPAAVEKYAGDAILEDSWRVRDNLAKANAEYADSMVTLREDENNRKLDSIQRFAEQERAILDEAAAYDAEVAAKRAAIADKYNSMLADGLTDGLMDFIDGTKSAKDAFADFAKSTIAQLAQIIIKQQLLNALGGGTEGGGVGGFIGTAISGAFASGGDAYPGQRILVGEKGPELLELGNYGGHITPNSDLRGGEGGQTTNVNITVNATDGKVGKESARQIRQAYQGVINRG